MKSKFETITIDKKAIIVDLSKLQSEAMFFNATEIAKQFGKRPDDFWKQEQNIEYLEVLITLSEGNKNNFVITRKGKYGGTWFHNELALQFARWLSPSFAVQLDKWIKTRLQQEQFWQQKRLEAKTGYKPLTDAIQSSHDEDKSHHYSNENNMLYRIILGMDAKKFKQVHGVGKVRDGLNADELTELSELQLIDTGLIKLGKTYDERKKELSAYHQKMLEAC